MNFRERILNFVCSGEDMESLSTSTQFSLLKKNLTGALVLLKYIGLNKKSIKEEMSFIFTNVDLEQFRVKQIVSNSIILQLDIFRDDHLELKE